MKPKPVVVTTICSECGLDWDRHGDNPTTSDCIRLLKAELAKPRPNVTIYPTVYPTIFPTYPTWPQPLYYGGGTYCGIVSSQGYNNSTGNTPAIEATCSAVSNV